MSEHAPRLPLRGWKLPSGSRKQLRRSVWQKARMLQALRGSRKQLMAPQLQQQR
jgi:hypothetical protein